jgi:hypothetical protein
VIAVADVEGDVFAEPGRVAVDVHQQDDVVLGCVVGVAVPVEDALHVERPGERDGNGLIHAPAVDFVDQRAGGTLESRRRDE